MKKHTLLLAAILFGLIFSAKAFGSHGETGCKDPEPPKDAGLGKNFPLPV